MSYDYTKRAMSGSDFPPAGRGRPSRVWVLDGGLATELESKGHSINGDPLWSARLLYSDPQAILEAHKSYLEHGADIIITASYQASVGGFCRELGVGRDEALNLIGRSVALAKQARQWYTDHHVKKSPALERPVPLIAGSVGPYGACQHDGSEYTGDYVDHMTKQALKDWHRPRLSALLSSGVDLLACETLPARLEAEAIVELLEDEFPTTRAWVSFSCKSGSLTCHGDEFPEAVASVAGEGREKRGEAREEGEGRGEEEEGSVVVAVGVNCTDPDYVEPLLRSAVGRTSLPFIVYPNSGEDWSSERHAWTGASKSIATETVKWMKLGATIVGGCCRVGPLDIQTIRQTVDQHKKNSLTPTHSDT